MKKRIIAILLSAALAAGMCMSVSAASLPANCSSEEWEQLKCTNRERLERGFAPLSTNADLQAIADVRAAELPTLFSHSRPDGTTCFTAYDVPYYYAGENIAAGYGSAAAVTEGWMNSTGHRENILNANFSHMGVGYTYRSDASYRHFWVQNFVGADCREENLRVVDAQSVYILRRGQTPEDLDLVLAEDCQLHGTTYLPVLSQMCAPINQSTAAEQQITITAGSQQTSVAVRVMPFVDVSTAWYYTLPVLWAAETGVTTGTDATHFAPEQSCTRAQVVTFLWRSAGSPAPEGADSTFADVPDGTYYSTAVRWAAEQGITTGVDAAHFAPEDTVTRAEFVTFLYRMDGRQGAAQSNPFADVSEDVYYYDAVLWAYNSGITTGVDAAHFEPNSPCTRGQVVSFLYRYFQP